LTEKNWRGIITDGDLRRMMERDENIGNLKAADIMNKNPKTISADAMAVDALKVLRDNNISQLVVTENEKFAGFIHLHDLLREGLI
jgi:arabinose-5-phosphate isomerase